MSNQTHTAKAWVVCKARRRTWGQQNSAGEYLVDNVRVKNVYAKRPAVEADEEAIEVTFEFPHDYFDTANPTIVIQVPNGGQPPSAVVKAVVKGKAPSAAAAIVHHP